MQASHIQYITDTNGRKLVQIPVEDWNSLQEKFSKYEQLLKVKRDWSPLSVSPQTTYSSI